MIYIKIKFVNFKKIISDLEMLQFSMLMDVAKLVLLLASFRHRLCRYYGGRSIFLAL